MISVWMRKWIWLKITNVVFSYRELSEKFKLSLGAVSNVLKRKCEYTNDDETNQNKKVKRKLKCDTSQEINDNVYDWFVAQRFKIYPYLDLFFKSMLEKYLNSNGMIHVRKSSWLMEWLFMIRTTVKIHPHYLNPWQWCVVFICCLPHNNLSCIHSVTVETHWCIMGFEYVEATIYSRLF
jgi:hypothetical protein